MGDMIDRDAALAIEGQLAKSMAHFLRVEQWQAYMAGVQEYRDAIAALEPAAEATRISRNGEHLFQTAKTLGWDDAGEGALEFVMRRTREVALEDAAPDAAAIREALLSLPTVYAHQINTGVREVYDPLQRFYLMEDVLRALITEKPHDRA